MLFILASRLGTFNEEKVLVGAFSRHNAMNLREDSLTALPDSPPRRRSAPRAGHTGQWSPAGTPPRRRRWGPASCPPGTAPAPARWSSCQCRGAAACSLADTLVMMQATPVAGGSAILWVTLSSSSSLCTWTQHRPQHTELIVKCIPFKYSEIQIHTGLKPKIAIVKSQIQKTRLFTRNRQLWPCAKILILCALFETIRCFHVWMKYKTKNWINF